MRRLIALLLIALVAAPAPAQDVDVVIGSKNFTEQEILGELVAQLIERHTDLTVQRRFGLGGTDICHTALVNGELDIYVEYTGTGLLNVLNRQVITNPDEAYRVVAQGYRERFDLHWLPPLGFNNTYAITVRQEHAGRLGLETIGDLAPHADRLSGGFTSEFMERPDGYPGLSKAYDIQLASTRDLDPGLMYQAVDQKQVDVICAFATDGRIAEYNLKTLDDDRHFFPPYDACPVVRGDLLDRHPQVRNALVALAGSIDDEQMRKLNYAVDVQKKTPADVARGWLDWRKGETPEPWRGDDAGQAEGPVNFWTLGWQRRGEVGQKTVEHLYLTVMGVVIAICIGVPLGVLIHRVAPARGPVLAFTEIMQTIPSLAMLAFLFVLYGLLGPAPAITALVLYALLPIVLNTFTGLKGVSPQVVEAANGVGMSGPQRLWMVELPLAAPVLIAGIRNATVLTVGIATLCTFIGAGGLGDFIARGLARSDARLTLLGAVPAAIMAVILSLGIRGLEKLSERT